MSRPIMILLSAFWHSGMASSPRAIAVRVFLFPILFSMFALMSAISLRNSAARLAPLASDFALILVLIYLPVLPFHLVSFLFASYAAGSAVTAYRNALAATLHWSARSSMSLHRECTVSISNH